MQRIRLNRPSAATMRPYVNLLLPLGIIVVAAVICCRMCRVLLLQMIMFSTIVRFHVKYADMNILFIECNSQFLCVVPHSLTDDKDVDERFVRS